MAAQVDAGDAETVGDERVDEFVVGGAQVAHAGHGDDEGTVAVHLVGDTARPCGVGTFDVGGHAAKLMPLALRRNP